jgi:hypothetical protein
VVSLTGSLETFSLPDVLALLASSAKTGELSVEGERARGRLWVAKGKLVGHDVARAGELVDALFELLRLPSGTFSFEADREASEPRQPVEVAGVLDAAKGRLDEWRGIEKVVPSLEATVRMAPTAPGPEVLVRAEQWQLLVAAGSGRSVISIMEETGLGEFDCCKAVRELAEAQMVQVTAVPKAASRPPARRPDRPRAARVDAPADEDPQLGESPDVLDDLDSLVEIPGRLRRQAPTPPAAPSRPSEAAAATPEPDESEVPATDQATAEDGTDELSDEPINRGLLLKFLSSVKD